MLLLISWPSLWTSLLALLLSAACCAAALSPACIRRGLPPPSPHPTHSPSATPSTSFFHATNQAPVSFFHLAKFIRIMTAHNFFHFCWPTPCALATTHHGHISAVRNDPFSICTRIKKRKRNDNSLFEHRIPTAGIRRMARGEQGHLAGSGQHSGFLAASCSRQADQLWPFEGRRFPQAARSRRPALASAPSSATPCVPLAAAAAASVRGCGTVTHPRCSVQRMHPCWTPHPVLGCLKSHKLGLPEQAAVAPAAVPAATVGGSCRGAPCNYYLRPA